MKILVLATRYSVPNVNFTHLFVQTRNKYYKKYGNEVVVLNFEAKQNYVIDGINVITLQYFKNHTETYKDYLLISHAPNIRNHYKFLKKYEKNFEKIVFFFHGHEVLKINKVYPKPYKYVKKNILKNIIQDIYDDVKLKLWKGYFTKIAYKSHFVFVSRWMYDQFIKWTKIDPKIIENKYSITYNGIGEQFEKLNYDSERDKKYDFVTIRTNLDGAKYSIDIVNELAKRNPEYKFLVVGKGNFFKYNQKAQNLQWIDKVLNHEEIIKLLNESKCALMPTRTDAQGLMMCEMATFGIPLITSDIPVCHEIFDDFKNVTLIDNDNIEKNDLKKSYEKINNKQEKNSKYFYKNTIIKELDLFKKITGETKYE